MDLIYTAHSESFVSHIPRTTVSIRGFIEGHPLLTDISRFIQWPGWCFQSFMQNVCPINCLAGIAMLTRLMQCIRTRFWQCEHSSCAFFILNTHRLQRLNGRSQLRKLASEVIVDSAALFEHSSLGVSVRAILILPMIGPCWWNSKTVRTYLYCRISWNHDRC